MRNFILLCFILIAGCDFQYPKELKFKLFDGDKNAAKFLFEFEIETSGDDEVVIRKTVFKNTIIIERQENKNMNSTYLIDAETNMTSDEIASFTGSEALIYPMIGLDANFVVSNKGDLVEFLGKEAVKEMYVNRLDFLSKSVRKKQLQKMRDNGDSVFFESLYTLNYKYLFTDRNEALIVHDRKLTESFVSATPVSPQRSIKREKELKFENNLYCKEASVISSKDSIVLDDGDGFFTEISPMETGEFFKIVANADGVISSIELIITTRRGGAKMNKVKGGVMESIMGESIEYRKIRYKRLED